MTSMRRTRFVCISDTHNSTVKLPPGDVLIHAGDLTNQGSYSELLKTVKWLEEADFEAKIVIAGNHDITLDADFYSEYGQYFHNQNPQSSSDCLSLLASSPTITYLCHSSQQFRLSSLSGPHTKFKVFGSPYSPRYSRWAFYYDAPNNPTSVSDAPELWKAIPLDADVVVTHTPPRAHLDETLERRPPGCEFLRQALWRVRPRLAVCGHIHDGRGAERVTWDLGRRNYAYAEKGVTRWDDPGAGSGNKKLSLVDLTGKKSPSLANDGSHPSSRIGHHGAGASSSPAVLDKPDMVDAQDSRESTGASTIGLGGDDPLSPRSDREALLGRMGRLETCIVNAAIMKSRYPHTGGKQYYKPIVVDIDLPVWTEDGES